MFLGSVHCSTSELMLVHRFLGGSTFYMLLTIYYKLVHNSNCTSVNYFLGTHLEGEPKN